MTAYATIAELNGHRNYGLMAQQQWDANNGTN